MAVTLPDFTALGRRPVPMGNRGFARQDTTAPGQAMEGMGQVVGKIGEEFAQRDDEQKVLEYRRKLIEWDKTNVHDPELGAAGKKGRDAFDLPKTLPQEFDKFAAEAASGLSSNRQRKIAQEIALGRREQIGNWASGHALREREVFDAGEFKANISAAKDNAVLYPTLADQELAKMAETTRRYLGSRIGPEAVAATIKQDASEVHARIIHGLVSDGNVDSAQDYFKKNAANMTAQNKDSAQTVLKEVGMRTKVQAFEDDARARGLSTEDALKEARAKFTGDPMTRDAAVARVHAMDAERTTLIARAQKEADERGAKIITNGGGRKDIPPALWLAMSENEQKWVNAYVEAKWLRAKADAEGTGNDPTPERLREYIRLRDLARDDPVAFLEIDLVKSEPMLTKQHWNVLATLRDGINKNDAKTQSMIQVSKKTLGDMRQELLLAGVDLRATDKHKSKLEKADQYRTQFEADLSAAAAHGKVDEAQAKRIARDLLRKGVVRGSGWLWDDDKRLFEVPVEDRKDAKGNPKFVTPYGAIPEKVRVEILGDLFPGRYGAKANLSVPSTVRDQVERAYARGKQAGVE